MDIFILPMIIYIIANTYVRVCSKHFDILPSLILGTTLQGKHFTGRKRDLEKLSNLPKSTELAMEGTKTWG